MKTGTSRWCVRFGLVALACASPGAGAETNLISLGATWRYHDGGVDWGTAWRAREFDDTQWDAGPAPLGYGFGDEATGIDGHGNRPTTVYFRHTFVIADLSTINNLTLRLVRDDGAAVYLNGTEVWRSNLPAGEIEFATPARVAVDLADESLLDQRNVWYGNLAAGTNTIAVEVHQAAGDQADSRFALELIANLPLTPPTVAIVGPANGTVVAVGEVPIVTEIADLDGHIYRVDFFAGATLIGQVFEPPFVLPWSIYVPGRYALKALAIDHSGRSGYSPVAHVQVGESVPDRLVRGPYLQSATPTSLVVRWRTDWFTDSQVWLGQHPAQLEPVASDPRLAVEHEIRLANLRPNTVYYYGVGTRASVLGGGDGYHFVTPPLQPKPTRVWVIGDSGTADQNARDVYHAYRDRAAGQSTDLWLMLGDNAYESGTDDEYQAAVFDMYPELLRSTVLWPTVGNHDAAFLDATGGFAYLDMFTLPTQGEAGGLASGTERYYSFDYSNVHWVCLDSHTSDRSPGSPMLTWLEADLAATDRDWIIAFCHHPPYSKGTHDSDRERQMIEIRENIVPILERYGADLMLTGHSHVYEQSYLINGHYGFSTNLLPGMILDAGSGNPSNAAPYFKPAGGLGAHQGTVYAVCGCSGEGGGFRVPDHPIMFASLTDRGSMMLRIDGLRLEAEFLSQYGESKDLFAIEKGVPGPDVRPRLTIERSLDPPGFELAWPTSLLPFEVMEFRVTPAETNWTAVTNPPVVSGRQHRLWLAPASESGQRWFRLRAEP